MDLRWRVALYVVGLIALAALDLRAPWGLVIGAVMYFIVVWPAIGRGPDGER